LVAQYADACNLFAPDPDVVAHKLEVLARHCDAEGRDPATIEKTILGFGDPLDDVDAFVATMDRYARLGVDLVEVMPVGPDPVGWVARFGEQVVPRLAELDPSR
jgi:alkanesulfonate monooxygenase SsuD/methylene tetrahydromethanopterin reductase-like flavin-dependent oxidoreductase (luciferase family)